MNSRSSRKFFLIVAVLLIESVFTLHPLPAHAAGPAEATPKSGTRPRPKYGPDATPLSAMSNGDYFRNNRAPDYWTLAPYYVPQVTERGCSAANLSMVLNAARVGMQLTAGDRLVTFQSLLEKYVDENYRKAVLGKTLFPGTNFSNQNLTRLLNEAARKLNVPNARPRAEFFGIDQADRAEGRRRLREALERNEKSADDYILFSFVQGTVTGDPEGGAHVATVGAYDAKKNLVLVMDPDREWYEPYWTPLDKLFDAVADPKSDSRKEAGWIYFKIR